LAYNVVALPIAAMGWVTPWMAAVGMAVSSVIVTLNALRLSRSRLTRKVS
jgi:Cu2+-exporting ATPase